MTVVKHPLYRARPVTPAHNAHRKATVFPRTPAFGYGEVVAGHVLTHRCHRAFTPRASRCSRYSTRASLIFTLIIAIGLIPSAV